MQALSNLFTSFRSSSSSASVQKTTSATIDEKDLTFSERVLSFFDHLKEWFNGLSDQVSVSALTQTKDPKEKAAFYQELRDIHTLESELAKIPEPKTGEIRSEYSTRSEHPWYVKHNEIEKRLWALWDKSGNDVTYDDAACFRRLEKDFGEKAALFVQGKLASTVLRGWKVKANFYSETHAKNARECFVRIDPYEFSEGYLLYNATEDERNKYSHKNDPDYRIANERLLDKKREQAAFEFIDRQATAEGFPDLNNVPGPIALQRSSQGGTTPASVRTSSSSQGNNAELPTKVNNEPRVKAKKVGDNAKLAQLGKIQPESSVDEPELYPLTSMSQPSNKKQAQVIVVPADSGSAAKSKAPVSDTQSNTSEPVEAEQQVEPPKGAMTSQLNVAEKNVAQVPKKPIASTEEIVDLPNEENHQAATLETTKTSSSARSGVAQQHVSTSSGSSESIGDKLVSAWNAIWSSPPKNEIQNALHRHAQEIGSNNGAIDEILSISQQVLAEKDIKNLAAAYDTLYKVQLTRPDYRSQEVWNSIESFWKYGNDQYERAQEEIKGTDAYWKHCRRAAFAGHLKANYELAAESPIFAYRHFVDGNKRLANLALQEGNSCYLRLVNTSKPDTEGAAGLMATVMFKAACKIGYSVGERPYVDFDKVLLKKAAQMGSEDAALLIPFLSITPKKIQQEKLTIELAKIYVNKKSTSRHQKRANLWLADSILRSDILQNNVEAKGELTRVMLLRNKLLKAKPAKKVSS